MIANVLYSGNNSNLYGPCEDDLLELFVFTADVITVNYDFQMPWEYEGHWITWANLGEVASGPAYTTMECDGVDYLLAAFSLDDDVDNVYNGFISTLVVKFGNHNQTLGSTATVWWNSGISKWNALMDVDLLSSNIDWQCTVSLCDSTGTGSKVNKSFRKGGPCDGMDNFNLGGPEEEEEEEE